MLDLRSKYYPKEVYNINENITRENMRKYDKMRDNWYNKALELFPDYFKRGLRERLEIGKEVDKAVGYSL